MIDGEEEEKASEEGGPSGMETPGRVLLEWLSMETQTKGEGNEWQQQKLNPRSPKLHLRWA